MGEPKEGSVFLQALFDLIKTANSSSELEDILNKISEIVSEALRVKGCSVRLLSQDKKFLLISAAHGLSEDYLKKGKVELSKSHIDQEVLEGNTVYLSDAGKSRRFQYPEEADAEFIKSVLAIPLRAQGKKSIGVFRVYSGTERQFNEEELQFLSAVGDLCAMAIEKARSHLESKKDYELLTSYEFRLYEQH